MKKNVRDLQDIKKFDSINGAVTDLQNDVPMRLYIPHENHVSKYIIRTKDNEYQALFKLDGVPFETVNQVDKDGKHNLLVNWLQSMATGQFAINTYLCRHAIEEKLTDQFSSDFASEVARKYYKQFDKSELLQNELYLIISFRPLSDSLAASAYKSMSRAEIERGMKEHISKLEDRCIQTMDTLKSFGIERLGMYTELDQNNVDRVYSHFLGFLSYLINGQWNKIEVLKKPISEYICYSQSSFKDEYQTLRTPTGTRYVAYLELVDLPEEYETGGLNKLMYEDFEFIQCTTFMPMHSMDADSRLETQIGHNISSGKVTQFELDSFQAAREALKEGKIVFGEVSCTISVFGDSFEKVKKNQSELFAVLNNSLGFKVQAITVVSAPAYFATIAGNWKYRTREFFITDVAYFGIVSLHNFASGKRTGNPWGEAVTMLKTPSKQPYFFNFHATPDDEDNEDDKAPANTVITGQTGAGKTVLEAFLLSQLTKVPDLRMCIYDKDKGLEIFVNRLGGLYLPIYKGVPTGLAPFQGLDDTPANRFFLNELVIECARVVDDNIDLASKLAVENGIRSVFSLPRHLRGFTTLLQNIPNTGDNSIVEKLKPWARDDGEGRMGQYAWILDNPADLIDYTKYKIYGYDYTDVLGATNSAAAAMGKASYSISTPIMMYLLHRQDELINGDPFVYVVAEAWKALDNPIFEGFIRDKQKTNRKLNAFGVFDTQEPADFINSRFGATIVQQSVTKIYLPNLEAEKADYIKMGCTEREFEIIKNEMPVESRKFLIKQNGKSALCKLDLKGMGDELDIMSGSTDNVEVFEQCQLDYGTDTSQWLTPFQNALAARRGKNYDLDFPIYEHDESAEFGVA